LHFNVIGGDFLAHSLPFVPSIVSGGSMIAGAAGTAGIVVLATGSS